MIRSRNVGNMQIVEFELTGAAIGESGVYDDGAGDGDEDGFDLVW
eukprot:CAMPEP_0194049742 /NCGR_PEP_ID=MMETSP0009_2-20130614/30869_1 /TAXON_ID=210454 /ORGANISM="Grammatophora oceanica, Strain CCMP 410" /LENGTH=44 /DNA_ID= /DNA_START= /DNA_END= /DNA_ORIENTATION=